MEESWRHICDEMGLKNYKPHQAHGAKRKIYTDSEIEALSCYDFATKNVNHNRRVEASDVSDEHLQYLELAHEYNPVSYRIWDEYTHILDEKMKTWPAHQLLEEGTVTQMSYSLGTKKEGEY